MFEHIYTEIILWFENFGRDFTMNSNPTYTIQKKIEDDDVIQLHRLYEAANPRNVKGDKLSKALNELYDAAKAKFDVLWKRPDGSRIFQLLFRRGDEELKNQLITDFEKILFQAATTRYSYYIVKFMISNGNAAQRDRIFQTLRGRYDLLLSHKIGHKVIEAIYENSNEKQKNFLFLDFYGPQWKKQKEPITFDEICKKGDSYKNAAIKTLSDNLRHVIDKNLGYLKITQKLLLILGNAKPSALAQFAIDFKEYCFSQDGSIAAIIAIQNASADDVKTALKLIEPTLRKPVVSGLGAPAISTPINQENMNEEEEEEEEAVEDFEQNGEEEDQNQNEQASKKKSKDNGELEVGEMTAAIANDQFAWRALCCAISYNNDMEVMKDEVIPNLFDQWDNICNNKNAVQLLIRLISVQPSVFHDLTFQKQPLNEDLKNYVLPILTDHVLQSIDTLGTMSKGSFLVATLMKILVSDPIFGRFAETIFTKENVVDKVMHKLVRLCISVVGKDAADLALDTINEVGIEEVLKTPGAWIIKELISTDNYKKFASQVINIIKKQNIEGQAIDSILNPSAEKVEKPKRRFDKSKKGNQKGGQKK